MPFNSNTYHRNKAKREACAYLSQARDAKAGKRAPSSIAWYVRMARSQWSIYLSYMSMKRCSDDLKAFQTGKMTYSEFMAKWGDTQ